MLRVEHLSKQYQQFTRETTVAIKALSFTVEPQKFVSIVGPSGCGKTTLLKCVCGLLAPTSGSVMLNGIEVLKPPAEMVLVFQDYNRSLLPWRSLLKNTMLGIEANKSLSGAEKEEIALSAINSVGLKGLEHHYPWELSGGQQQRAAIARALAYQCEILLMDEPFASVDAQTREDLEDMLLELWAQFSKTVLFITHDIEESIYLADTVIVLSERPSVVADEITIDLPRPRSQLETREHPKFIEYRHHVYSLIRGETSKRGAGG